MRKFIVPVVSLFGIVLAVSVSAGEKEVRKGLKELDPSMPIQSVNKSVVMGLYEVVIGTDVYYVSANGKYIISGNIFEAESRKNLTELTKGRGYLKLVNQAGESGMIIYQPRKKVRRTLTVFTDVDCPYCRKFHKDMPAHLEAGIRVRYIMFPLRGLNTPTYKKSVSVWCSKDRKKALDTVKSGGSIKERDCPNPLQRNFELAQAMSITGTPTLMTEEGILYRGYVPKDELHARLGLGSLNRAGK